MDRVERKNCELRGRFWVVSGFLARPSVVRDNDINSKEKAEEENIYIVSLMDQPSLSSLSSRDYRDCGMVHVNIQIFFVRIMRFFLFFDKFRVIETMRQGGRRKYISYP